MVFYKFFYFSFIEFLFGIRLVEVGGFDVDFEAGLYVVSVYIFRVYISYFVEQYLVFVGLGVNGRKVQSFEAEAVCTLWWEEVEGWGFGRGAGWVLQVLGRGGLG